MKKWREEGLKMKGGKPSSNPSKTFPPRPLDIIPII